MPCNMAGGYTSNNSLQAYNAMEYGLIYTVSPKNQTPKITRAADRLKILITINCAIKKFNRD